MPWKKMEVQQQRVEFVIRAAAGKETMSGLCREFGISRTTGYEWLRRYRARPELGQLREKSRRPHRSPRRTPAQQEQRVVELWQRWGWGARKLANLLERQGRPLPWITVHRILRRHGLVDSSAAGQRAPQRFEREEPNQLWQMDTKGPYRLEKGHCHALSILDDHSRYAVGLYALRGLRAHEVHGCLVQTFKRYGLPQAMLMDHGTPWWSTTNARGLTWLSVALIEPGIELLYGRIRHPQTQGKVERFQRTLGEGLRHRGRPREWSQWGSLFEEFRSEYNQVRPHEAIGMVPPAKCYRSSQRRYQSQPARWDYGPEAEVQRLNSAGCLSNGGRRWFVCEALAEREVALERLPGKIVVRFRHMYIREIDTLQGCTMPLAVSSRRYRSQPTLGR